MKQLLTKLKRQNIPYNHDSTIQNLFHLVTVNILWFHKYKYVFCSCFFLHSDVRVAE